ncbi:TPA: hypothetical protein IHM15_004852, partial [Escherichia coli]|nr:hypothetical protein [Escherichia coli]
GTAATAGNLALSKLLHSRAAAAREILVEEIKLGVKDSTEISPEDAAAITFRYMRAATEGTARLNLRLLAAVASGQTQAPAFYADDFLAIADALSGLRREEIIVLGVVQQHAKKTEFKLQRKGEFWLECLTTLRQKHGISRDLADGYAAS